MVTLPINALVAVAVGALLLTGCASTPDPTPERTAAASQAGQDPEALRENLRQIDERLDDEASVDDADAVCLELEEGKDDPAIEEAVRSRFGERAGGELSDEQIVSIVEVLKGEYCG